MIVDKVKAVEKGHEIHESLIDGDELFLRNLSPYALFISQNPFYSPNICNSIIGVVNVKLQETFSGGMPFYVHCEASPKRMESGVRVESELKNFVL